MILQISLQHFTLSNGTTFKTNSSPNRLKILLSHLIELKSLLDRINYSVECSERPINIGRLGCLQHPTSGKYRITLSLVLIVNDGKTPSCSPLGGQSGVGRPEDLPLHGVLMAVPVELGLCLVR